MVVEETLTLVLINILYIELVGHRSHNKYGRQIWHIGRVRPFTMIIFSKTKKGIEK